MRDVLFKAKVQLERMLINIFTLSSILNPKKSMEFMRKATPLIQKVKIIPKLLPSVPQGEF